MNLNFNNFGKVRIEEIRKMDLPYLQEKDGWLTYSELKEQLYQKYGCRIHWNYEERVKYSSMWLCSKLNRGCSPLYLIDEVYVLLKKATTD